MGRFALRTVMDAIEGEIPAIDSSIDDYPAELGPRLISATMLTKTKTQEGSVLFGDDDWQYTTKYAKVKEVGDIAKIQQAADGRYG